MLEGVPEEIARTREVRKVIGGRGLRYSDSVKMLQAPVSEAPTFRYIGSLDECAAEHRVKLMVRPIRASNKASSTRVTGRPHSQDRPGGVFREGLRLYTSLPEEVNVFILSWARIRPRCDEQSGGRYPEKNPQRYSISGVYLY